MASSIAGALRDPFVFILTRMAYDIGAISQSQVVAIPRRSIAEIPTRHPGIARPF